MTGKIAVVNIGCRENRYSISYGKTPNRNAPPRAARDSLCLRAESVTGRSRNTKAFLHPIRADRHAWISQVLYYRHSISRQLRIETYLLLGKSFPCRKHSRMKQEKGKRLSSVNNSAGE